jgi:hypothetical protein
MLYFYIKSIVYKVQFVYDIGLLLFLNICEKNNLVQNTVKTRDAGDISRKEQVEKNLLLNLRDMLFYTRPGPGRQDLRGRRPGWHGICF